MRFNPVNQEIKGGNYETADTDRIEWANIEKLTKTRRKIKC